MKKAITGTIEGTITKEISKEYHRILADAIVDQYGVDAAKKVLKRLKEENK